MYLASAYDACNQHLTPSAALGCHIDMHNVKPQRTPGTCCGLTSKARRCTDLVFTSGLLQGAYLVQVSSGIKTAGPRLGLCIYQTGSLREVLSDCNNQGSLRLGSCYQVSCPLLQHLGSISSHGGVFEPAAGARRRSEDLSLLDVDSTEVRPTHAHCMKSTTSSPTFVLHKCLYRLSAGTCTYVAKQMSR